MYAFENRENDIRTYFSRKVVDGVTVSCGDYKLTLSPVVSVKNVSTAQKINSLMVSDSIEAERVSYSNVYDDNTSIIISMRNMEPFGRTSAVIQLLPIKL